MRIGFVGPARAGKDYAAAHLVDLVGGHILRFADPLYDLMYMMQDYVGFERVKDRALLQWVGTEWGRGHDPDVWIRLMDRRLAELDGSDTSVFVPDVRFPAEADLLKRHGFSLVRIERANLPNADAPWRQHESERAMDSYSGYDHVLTNCAEGDGFLAVVRTTLGVEQPDTTVLLRDSYIITPP